MPAARPSSVRARQLAAELRRLREATGMTGEEMAARLGWSPSKVSRIETARIAISGDDLRRLLDLYQATDALPLDGSLRERLTELGRTAHRRGWWDSYADTLRHRYSAFVALEDDAASEFVFSQGVVPGLLQTAGYAEAMMHAVFPASPPGEIRRRVQVRMKRQQSLTKSDPLELMTVLDESVLRRRVGGPDVMVEQLTHLTEMTGRPNITIQVLPFAAGSHVSISGSYVGLRLPGPSIPYIVYLETMTSETLIENEAEAYHYSLAFDRLREMALGSAESIDFIDQVKSEY